MYPSEQVKSVEQLGNPKWSTRILLQSVSAFTIASSIKLFIFYWIIFNDEINVQNLIYKRNFWWITWVHNYLFFLEGLLIEDSYHRRPMHLSPRPNDLLCFHPSKKILMLALFILKNINSSKIFNGANKCEWHEFHVVTTVINNIVNSI